MKNKIERTIILPVVLYGCEKWLFMLREKRRLKMFDIRFLRRIFVPKRDVSTGDWKRLGNE
jgi:1-acyl-sn-glycerol-3-phosphate acyltransferase